MFCGIPKNKSIYSYLSHLKKNELWKVYKKLNSKYDYINFRNKPNLRRINYKKIYKRTLFYTTILLLKFILKYDCYDNFKNIYLKFTNFNINSKLSIEEIEKTFLFFNENNFNNILLKKKSPSIKYFAKYFINDISSIIINYLPNYDEKIKRLKRNYITLSLICKKYNDTDIINLYIENEILLYTMMFNNFYNILDYNYNNFNYDELL